MVTIGFRWLQRLENSLEENDPDSALLKHLSTAVKLFHSKNNAVYIYTLKLKSKNIYNRCSFIEYNN